MGEFGSGRGTTEMGMGIRHDMLMTLSGGGMIVRGLDYEEKAKYHPRRDGFGRVGILGREEVRIEQ